MNRKRFLRGLRKHLSFLEREELESVVLEYINRIDCSKKKDEEIIATFGSFKDIQREVAEKYSKDSKKVLKKENGIQDFYKNLKNFGKIIKNSEGKKKGKIFFDLLLLILITCILKIPFLFLRDIGDRYIATFLDNNLHFLASWGLIIEIIYIIVAISFFIRTFQKWFKNLK